MARQRNDGKSGRFQLALAVLLVACIRPRPYWPPQHYTITYAANFR
jgi:hypothetical protein